MPWPGSVAPDADGSGDPVEVLDSSAALAGTGRPDQATLLQFADVVRGDPELRVKLTSERHDRHRLRRLGDAFEDLEAQRVDVGAGDGFPVKFGAHARKDP